MQSRPQTTAAAAAAAMKQRKSATPRLEEVEMETTRNEEGEVGSRKSLTG